MKISPLNTHWPATVANRDAVIPEAFPDDDESWNPKEPVADAFDICPFCAMRLEECACRFE